ncbi:MAG: zinc-dependent metalloprotease [Actinobacteria bacterium]|nr:zinc-dependent metalloprotease [Actinomycetota bacterium]
MAIWLQHWEDSHMSPFGFTPDSSDEPEKNKDGESVDFAAMMAQMQQQIQQQFSTLGMSAPGFSATTEALPKIIVRDTAKKFVTAKGSAPIGANDVAKIEEAFAIAELWLNEATYFSQTSTTGNPAMARTDWVDTTLNGWQVSVEPLATGLAAAISELLNNANGEEGQSEAENAMQIPVGMIATLLRSFIGSLIATQLGQSIGGLAASVTGTHDVGLPLVEPVYPSLVPQNIDEWGQDLNIPMDEVRIFHALRESALARLFAHNPWLISYIRTAISDYGKGIRIDIDAIQRQAQEVFDNASQEGKEFDPTNPESFNIALNEGIFTPEETPAQRAALTKLETVLALIDGWSEEVVTLAAGDRLPNLVALQETLRRRRATSAPAQQLFATMFGLQVSPKLSREASTFWKAVREVKELEGRDRIWSGILPTSDDLLTPQSYLASIEIPDDLSGL